MTEVFDLVVIGSGPAGEKGAAQAAYFGKKVAIVERSPQPGGAVVSNAEIPSKTLRETALYITGFRMREVYGLSLHLDQTVALQTLAGRTAEVTATATQAVQANTDRHGVDLIYGHGTSSRAGRFGLKPHRAMSGCSLLARFSLRPVPVPSTRPGFLSRTRMCTTQ